ncbi:FkbM family methyltransferase [Terracidiphilus gabretensis]|jgi:FkbM family methyltransferase|uniref:FkbM family methyltransferase n=1 Tax=Terracidiphilus gabretensis TaxID=1577687 RepID=UPI00071B9949|nr:FkbM family methyltransferase [Terracidiphilus gabretensis]
MSLLRTLGYITDHPMNRDRKAAAILRYFHWQIGSRILGKPVMYEWLPGVRVILRQGEKGMTQNLYCGLHDFSDMAFVLHTMTPQDLFIDIGANSGAYTVLACGFIGSRGYCFEPVPSTYSRLLDNLFINQLQSRVTALNLGLSDQEEEILFSRDHDAGNHALADHETDLASIHVPVCTLDSVLSAESPSMIKIDVEGFETKVLAGAKETLSKSSLHSIIMELNGSGNRYGFDEGKILETMRDYGFLTYLYDPIRRELHALKGKNNSHGNTLFIRNADAVQEKFARAPRMTIGQTEF